MTMIPKTLRVVPGKAIGPRNINISNKTPNA